MAPVFAPVTENTKVQHILKLSQEASKEIGQSYTIVTFDLAVVKKAYAIIWQNPQGLDDIIVRMGVFHLTCAYMAALGKSIRGSGFEEILVESGICASGSIAKVLNGKHYNRAIRVHKIVLEALEHLLLQEFEACTPVDEKVRTAFIHLSKNPSEERLKELLSNDKCRSMLALLPDFKDKICKGEVGKTAQYWLTYMDRVWNILHLQ